MLPSQHIEDVVTASITLLVKLILTKLKTSSLYLFANFVPHNVSYSNSRATLCTSKASLDVSRHFS